MTLTSAEATRHRDRGSSAALRTLVQVWVLAMFAGMLTVATASSASAAAAPVTNAPMRMTVDSAHPMLMTQLVMGHNIGFGTDFTRDDNQRGWSVQQAWAGVPDDVKPNMVFVLHPGHNNLMTVSETRKWAEDNIKEGADLGIKMMMLWGETPTNGTANGMAGTAWIESLYQNYPNFIGTDISELIGYKTSDLPILTKLANSYGGYHVQGTLEENNILMGALENQSYWDSMKPYAQNFIYTPKNMHENLEVANAGAQGAWLSGIFGNWGPYFDSYPFYGCGIFGTAASSGSLTLGDRCSRTAPETGFAMAMLDQWQQGATVYQMENQLDLPGMDSLYSPLFYQSILPAFRYIVAHPSPTKAQVLANTKVAFSEAAGAVYSLSDTAVSGRNSLGRPTMYDISESAPNINGSQGLWWYLRASGRYYNVPRIPKLAGSAFLSTLTGAGVSIIDKPFYEANLLGLDNRVAYFNSKYPQISSGDAYVQNVGNTYNIYNTKYMDNVNQSATVPLSGSAFTEMALTEMTPGSYAAVTKGQTSLDIQLNNYRDDKTKDILKDGARVERDMEWVDDFTKYSYVPNPQDQELRTDTLTVTSAVQPVLTISGYDKHYTYTEDYNAATQRYTLTVRHNGVVNIQLNTSRTDAGLTTVPAAGPDVAYTGSWTGSGTRSTSAAGAAVQYTADATTLQWTAPAGAGGTADVFIDGTRYASGLAVPAAGGTIFQATGLTNEPHTIRIVNTGGQVGVASLAYQPSVEHMLNDIEMADFTYASAAEDQDTVWGSTHWTVRDGTLKLLPYVTPWFGETTVYNKAVSAADVTYQADITMLKGTPGTVLVRGNPTLKQSYMLRLDPTNFLAGGEIALVRDNTTVLATSTALDLAVNTTYTVKLQATGNRIQGWINGTQVIDFTDTSSSARTAAGYTGVRVEPKNAGGINDFIVLDNVSVTSGDAGAASYTSDFSSWASASSWQTEGPLMFDAKDNRTSVSFPWQWTQLGAANGTWAVTKAPVYTNGLSGVFSGAAAAASPSVIAAGESSLGNVVYSSAVKPAANAAAGLTFRVQDADNYYVASLDTAAGKVALVKNVAGTRTTIATVDRTVAASAWHQVRVSVKGSLITVSVDGAPVLSAQDSTFSAGKVGYWLPAGSAADFDNARLVRLPAITAATGPVVATVTPAESGPVHITGFVPVQLKSLKDSAPALPGTVTAINSDGSRTNVAVTWDAVPASQYSLATTPYANGLTRGKFTVAGTVAGTTVRPVTNVTVMPKLSAPLTTTYTYDSANPGWPPTTFATVRYDAGGGTTYTRTVHVSWDQKIAVSASTPTQTLTGTIEDDPLEKATATVTRLVVSDNLALNKPAVAYFSLNNTARTPAKMVDGITTTGWYTGGATDGSFSESNSSTFTQGSLCSWIYVDLGAEYTIGSYSITFGENLTTFGSMFNAPFDFQVVDGSVAPTDARLKNSTCTRSGAASPYPTTTAEQIIWKTASSGVGTVAAKKYTLAAPTKARYVRIFTNEPNTAHRSGTAIFDLAVFAPTDTTAPSVSPAVAPAAPDGDGGWYRSAVTVTGTATDDSGAAPLLQTATDGGSWAAYAPVKLTTDGVHSVALQATDAAGNTSSPATVTAKIDATPPTVALLGGPAGTTTYGNVPADGTCSASDSTSGVRSCVVTGYATSTGEHTLTATATDQAGNTATATRAYTVVRADQTINLSAAGAATFGDADVTVTATATSGLPVTLSATGSCTLTGTSLHLIGAGDCTIDASQPGNENYLPAPNVESTISVSKAKQSVSFTPPTDKTFGDPDFTVAGTATSSLPVTFTADGSCTVNNTTVHLTGAGDCTITASQAGDDKYNPADGVTATFTVAKAGQTLTFDQPSARTFGDSNFTVAGTASSGLPVTFSADGSCTVTDGIVTLTGAGSCSLQAHQGGSADYLAAPVVTRSFEIAKADQAVALQALNTATFGDPDVTVSATATSGLPVTLEVSGPCTLEGSSLHLTGSGNCTLTASQTGNGDYNAAQEVSRTISIDRAGQAITLTSLKDRQFGDADFTVSATATSGLSVTFTATGSCTLTGSTVHLTGGGRCTVTASQPGNADYNPADDVSGTFTIAPKDQTITFDAVPSKLFGDSDFSVTPSASSGLPVTLTAAGACTAVKGTVHLVGAGTCSLTAVQAGNGDYNPAPAVTRTFQIAPYTFRGFYQPVDMESVNTAKAGSTVPMKFEVFRGATELTSVSQVSSITYASIPADSSATTDEIETLATGGTQLSYDIISGQFLYKWKTPSTPGNYRLTVQSLDGSRLTADFRLR